MSWRSSLKILIGIIVLLGVMIALVAYTDKQMGEVSATEARLTASSYSVGADHTSVIVRQFVEPGSSVEVDQTLFELKSTSLTEALADEQISEDELLYPLNEAGNILIKASKKGTVSEVFYGEGSFVPANSEIATIFDENSVKAEARFALSPKEFSMLSNNTQLVAILPNGQEVSGRITSIDVVDDEGVKETEVTALLGTIETNGLHIANGAPVDAHLILQEPKLYQKVNSYVQRYL